MQAQIIHLDLNHLADVVFEELHVLAVHFLHFLGTRVKYLYCKNSFQTYLKRLLGLRIPRFLRLLLLFGGLGVLLGILRACLRQARSFLIQIFGQLC